MPRIELSNPWVAASDELEQLLVKRQAEKQQEFLNRLAMQREARLDEAARQQAEYQNELAGSLREQRAAAAAKAEQEALLGRLSMYRPGDELPEDLRRTMQERQLGGLMEQQTREAVPAEAVAFVDPSFQPELASPVVAFKGTAKQREDVDARKRLEALLDDPSMPDAVKQALRLELATGNKVVTGSMFEPKEEKHSPIYLEWQDYKKAGGTQSFEEYMNADANRKRPVTHVTMGNSGLTSGQVIQAGKMADDYRTDSKDFISRSESYGTVRSALQDPSAAGDLSLIFAYMKMLDPGSVVREGEFATAQNTAGVPDRIRNQYNRLIKGERLTDGQRADFGRQAENIYRGARERQSRIRKTYEERSAKFGIPADLVVMDYGVVEEPPAVAPATGNTPRKRFNPATGKVE